MIDQHTLQTLEFPKVVAAIAGNCLTPYGREAVATISPFVNRMQIETHLREVSEMKDIIQFGDPFPLYRMEDDCRLILERATAEGSHLDPKELLKVLELLVNSRGLKEYAPDHRHKFQSIDNYLKALHAFPELQKEINKTIDEHGEVRDSASPKLKATRLEIADGRRRVVSKLESMLASGKKSGIADDIVTQRNERYVMTVPSDSFRSDMGILHDRSGSGATLYIEPKEVVEFNNRIQTLLQDERLEIDRILRALTKQISEHGTELIENCTIIGTLDRLHACAANSVAIKGHAPSIAVSPSLSLKNARHPLLILNFGSLEKVVPATVALDENSQAILITGPNTGGKTVLLKTVGLSVLMALSGLHIAADRESEVGMFDNLFADIGDEQSIELSLSTFSSHVRNIVSGLQNPSPTTLLLFDEVGAGTDPKDGAALAESVLLYAIDKGAKVIATTHYSQLKTLALDHPEIENASMEFDLETLSPTYRLRMGLPGSSYGIEIATRLGLPKAVCEAAAKVVGSEERSLTRLITSLENELAKVREDRIQLTDRLTKATAYEQEYEAKIAQLQQELITLKQQALNDTQQFVESTRKQIEQEVANIRATQATESSVKSFHQQMKQVQTELTQRTEAAKPKRIDSTKFKVGDSVRIISINAEGVIAELIGKSKARVRVGNMVTTAETRNLERIEGVTLSPSSTSSRRQAVPEADIKSPEIHLRGMTVEEATEALAQFIDQALIAGLRQIYVIHGKGTGTLRRTLTDYLKNHREVESYRLGDWNEGGAGVTIVRLKE